MSMTKHDKTMGSIGVGCAPNTVAVHNQKGNVITIFILRKALKNSGILCSFSSTRGTTQNGQGGVIPLKETILPAIS